MRISDSHHRVPLRANPRQIWSKVAGSFRPWLHLQNVALLLDNTSSLDEVIPVSGKGKKRALPLRSASSRAKRSKSAGSSSPQASVPDNDWPQDEYPFLSKPSCAAINHDGEIHQVPVWKHTLCIEPYKDDGNLVNAALDVSQRHGEDLLNERLKYLFAEIEEPITVDLGPVEIHEYNKRLVATSPDIAQDHLDEDTTRSNWLCLLPTFTDGRDKDSYDLGSLMEDIFWACHLMRLMRRATIEGRLELVALPFDWTQTISEELPFQLVIQINVSFVLPFLFQPCLPETPRNKASLLERSKRRLLHHLYFPSSDSESETVINIPFFYSCLKPAPLLPSKRAENAMQPRGLIPQLLPFQRRSVSWLLQREGRAVTATGKIVPSTEFKDHSFWDEIQEGNHTWYYNRLSDEVVPNVVTKTPVLGAILAEEPGLGKTLETIALMLLNPAPPDRNPTVKRWDPEARLDVHAIKVRTWNLR